MTGFQSEKGHVKKRRNEMEPHTPGGDTVAKGTCCGGDGFAPQGGLD